MSQRGPPIHGKGGDVSYIRATSANNTGSLPMAPLSPTGNREKNSTPMSNISLADCEFNDRDEMLLRELEEAKSRAAQMEKTMRWWSDCTGNWREKWNKARDERNKAREENRQLRSKLEAIVKELTLQKRDRHDLMAENDRLKQQLELRSLEKDGRSSASSSVKEEDLNNGGSSKEKKSEMDDTEKDVEDISTSNDKMDSSSNAVEKDRKDSVDSTTSCNNKNNSSDVSNLLPRLSLQLEESEKIIEQEKREKCEVTESMVKLQAELTSLKSKYEEIKKQKQEAYLELTKVKDSHKDDVSRLSQELDEESSTRSGLDKKIAELRRELERLQSENASEWAKRERLETEKLALERENKKLRSQAEDLEEQLERKSQQTSAIMDSDMKTLQMELSEKHKELNDLKHIHVKVKKTYQDKLTELDHTKRRTEQYELEVKKLRSRIEELKRDLANSEDEVDIQVNNVRKLQRTNDELQAQVETLQVQNDHIQSRLKRSSQPCLAKSRSSSLKSFALHDDFDADDSDLDLGDTT
ncbi:coiled-coil domain-containing protein 102A isoform X2 [Patella vulgata]|uniref:coiled-coil domain-containing protein 102A isoform X2 n=1 Tax=Patella vulgata TaxID=6465 RepID=UPI00217FA700|nr:coiled-coil domain-containing protein 102A isoform X2 [Patella vulgata]